MCQKKLKVPEKIIVISSDTIPYEKMRSCWPDTTLTQDKISRICFSIALAKHTSVTENAQTRILVSDFKDILNRESGLEWNLANAERIYKAGMQIKALVDTARDNASVVSFLKTSIAYTNLPYDSLLNSLQNNIDKIEPSLSIERKKEITTALIFSLLYADTLTAKAISDYIYSTETSVKENQAVMERVIKGLVFTQSAEVAKIVKNQKQKVPQKMQDNTMAALKFRPQKSIEETIRKHIPDIMQLYKKGLKRNSRMQGVVFVTFQVDPSGKTAAAAIKSSQINDQEFLNTFLEYVQKITFKPIPEDVGIMTFHFPFEFKPELGY
jgi:TonB family protein